MSDPIPFDVDVVVITYRSAHHLGRCLEPLLPSRRVLVIDNASDDESPSIARELGCRVIVNAHNIGFARAVNQAMEATSAPFVLFVNPDAIVDGDAIERLREELDDGSIGVTAASLVEPSGRPQRSSWPFPRASRSWAEAFGLHRFRRPSRPAGDSSDVASIVGACMLVRREAWVDVGGFDERFWLYGEESDFCRRLADRGWRRTLLATARAIHEGGASGAGSDLAAENFLHGTDRFVLHHDGRAALVSQRLALLVGSLLRLPVLLLRSANDPRVTIRRRAIRHCLHELRHHPFTVPTRPLEDVEQIVLCSLENWDEVWRRNQLLVRELVDDIDHPTRVLFVEPPVDVLHEVRTATRTERARLPRPCIGRPGVFVFRPRKVWPRILGPWADRSLTRQARDAAANVGLTDPVLWINDSTYAPLLDDADRTPSLYDITDDWLQEDVAPRELRRRRRRETSLLRLADRVVVCSPALEADRSRSRPVTVITNAVDVATFQRSAPRPAGMPTGKVATYVGTLHRERIDLELVERCAIANPDATIATVGPNALDSNETRRLESHPNIRLLGPRLYDEVPAWLQHSDVVIVPHVVSAFTESLDPIKAYECRAVGTCTLATPVASFRDQLAPIVIADRESFPSRLSDLLADPPPSSPDTSVPTWSDQATLFRAEIAAARTRSGSR